MTEIADRCKHGYTVSLRANGKPRCPYCRAEQALARSRPEAQPEPEAEPTPPPRPKHKRKKE